MQIVVYNPMSAAAQPRLDDISHEFRTIDAVVLVGTGYRETGPHAVTRKLLHHSAIQFGWKKPAIATGAAGSPSCSRRGGSHA